MTAAIRPARRRVPPWVLPILATLPLWAVLYAGSFGDRASAEQSPVQLGERIYRSSGCSGCHRSNGQGSATVPALKSTHKTFPEFSAHVQWVEEGSLTKKGDAYGEEGRVATGGMPGFGQQLSVEEIAAVVCYERVTLSRQEPPPAECLTRPAAAAP